MLKSFLLLLSFVWCFVIAEPTPAGSLDDVPLQKSVHRRSLQRPKGQAHAAPNFCKNQGPNEELDRGQKNMCRMTLFSSTYGIPGLLYNDDEFYAPGKITDEDYTPVDLEHLIHRLQEGEQLFADTTHQPMLHVQHNDDGSSHLFSRQLPAQTAKGQPMDYTKREEERDFGVQYASLF